MAKRLTKIERIHPNLAKEIAKVSAKNQIPKVQASREIAEYVRKARVQKVKIKRRDISF